MQKNKGNNNNTDSEINFDFNFMNLEDVSLQNYKVKKIIFEADSFKNFVFKFDDSNIIGKFAYFAYFFLFNFLDLSETNKIEIGRYERNDKHMSIPIAVFSPVN